MRSFPCFVVAVLAIQAAWANPIHPSGLLPETGPYDSFASFFSPDPMPGVGGAVGADYIRTDGRRLGALLAAQTIPGHDAEVVGELFAQGRLSERHSRVMAGLVFDVLTITQQSGHDVFVIGFTAYAEGHRMIVDGSSPHQVGPDALHVLAWAESAELAALLIVASLDLMSSAAPLGFVQEAPDTQIVMAAPSIFPNPCAAFCAVEIVTQEGTSVNLALFDMLGRQVALLATGQLNAGAHRFGFAASQIPGGIYIARLVQNGRASATRVTVVH